MSDRGRLMPRVGLDLMSLIPDFLDFLLDQQIGRS